MGGRGEEREREGRERCEREYKQMCTCIEFNEFNGCVCYLFNV